MDSHTTGAALAAAMLAFVSACGRAEPVPLPMPSASPAPQPPDVPPASSLPPGSDLTALTSAEQRALCEWQIVTMGGASRIEWCVEPCMNGACPEGIKTAPWSLETCVARFSSALSGCTVAELEQCTVELAVDLCAVPPSCESLKRCL